MTRIRLFLLVEGASFASAALVHFGVLFEGTRHRKAGIAESVIAAVLLAGLALTWLRRAWTRSVGIAVQAFALLGTLVGVFTIAIGIGPRTNADVAYHVAVVAVLVCGLVVSARRAPVAPSVAR